MVYENSIPALLSVNQNPSQTERKAGSWYSLAIYLNEQIKGACGGKTVPGSWRGGRLGEVFSKISSIYCCLCYHTSRDETLLLFNSFAMPAVWDFISLQELRVWALHF